MTMTQFVKKIAKRNNVNLEKGYRMQGNIMVPYSEAVDIANSFSGKSSPRNPVTPERAFNAIKKYKEIAD